jgi:hypothetical protein
LRLSSLPFGNADLPEACSPGRYVNAAACVLGDEAQTMDDKVVTRRKKYVFTPPKATWTLETRLSHPANGTLVYGVLPPIRKVGALILEGGDIVLRYGKHIGDRHSKTGFGFKHIWTRRFHTILDEKAAMTAVSHLVASIVRPGALIYWETGEKCAVFCNANGEVIVEERGRPGSRFYSVVTAIKPPVNAQGSLMGTL